MMTPDDSSRWLLTINGGSSSIKFAAYGLTPEPHRLLSGLVDRMGSSQPQLTLTDTEGQHASSPIKASDPANAVKEIVQALRSRLGAKNPAAIGHRIVHGGPNYSAPQRITPELLAELKRFAPFVPNHLPGEIALIETVEQQLPGTPQIACFDTAFHHDLPDVARLLPVPRKYEARGVRRYGFHGLSYSYLLEELKRVAGEAAADGRVILAHLGNGASLAAVIGGRCIDTSMGFTPTGGLVMGTRTGDLDPGLLVYLARTDGLTPEQLEDLTTRQSGLLGLSDSSSDMRDLLACEQDDIKCAQAVAVFCYQARKWIGAFAAALGGLDTLVFSGGIGEHAAPVRERICRGLEFLDVCIHPAQNNANEPVISTDAGRVVIRVIATDEEAMIAREACRIMLDRA
ncbi:MAG: acetate/propionate family kinase [Planctomycetota bacterium]|nr:acetate/propionate family kinase [Planctomycetota bacterium]